MLDAGVDLRDVQIAARHADPRTTMRYESPPEPGPPSELHPGRWHDNWVPGGRAAANLGLCGGKGRRNGV